MDIKWLEDFLSLCNSGNFRVSSEQRCISQPAFSRRIKALETWVGAELITRTSHPVHLSDAGKEFKPIAEDIVRLAYQARDNNRALDPGKEVVIHFSTLSTLAQFFIPGWLKGLQPYIEMEQFNVRTDFVSIDDYLGGLADGAVDFFIGYEDPAGSDVVDPEKYPSLHLGEETLVPVVCPDSNGKPMWWLPAKPLGAIPYLHTNSTLSLWPIRKHLEKLYGDLTFTPVYESSIATALKAMAIEGYGVAWIPRSIVVDDLENGRLVRAAEEKDDIAVDIKIYRFAGGTDSKVEKFWQVLIQQQN